MMDFYIKQIIIHQFSPNDTELVLSDTPLTLTPRIDDYFRKKLSKVFSDEAKRGYFGEDNVFMSHLQDDLYVSSCQIAQLWKEEFVISEDQKTNDLVFIQFDKDGMEHFAFLRISLKEQFAHVSENQEQPITITQNNLPSAAQTPDEALVVIIWRGNLNIANHLLSQGMLVALINYLLQILVELLKMTMLVTSLNQSYISAKRIIAVFERPSEIIDDKLEPKYSNKALEVQEMAFSYPNSSEKALSDITFSMNVGETLGIIGGTGSGKSTLVNLLLHIYKVQEGDIDIYHQGKSPDTISNWRTLVRVVPQNAQLFKGTIRSNLSLGLGKVSEEKLWTALEIAQASDFVKEKDGQLDAPVESFGRNFSGGQRQRLTIARALVQDKIPFLILDDATSALDYLTEARLFKAITKHFNQTNLIIVSQRINSIQNADRILLLDKGKQVGFDNHQSLLAHNKVYKSIYHSQNFKEEE